MTRTSAFGVGGREGHDASEFYGRELYAAGLPRLRIDGVGHWTSASVAGDYPYPKSTTIICASSERMAEIPDGTVGLAFTSPPYNVGKQYDTDLSMAAYLNLLGQVAAEVERVLVPGGRYVVNMANLGRNPYIPMTAYLHAICQEVGLTAAGDLVWEKAKGASGSCAWGSWRSARAPRVRDVHEYLQVFCKGGMARPDRGESDLAADEFMAATLSVWQIAPESARRVGHPAPFPLELAERVIRLWSYQDDIILDPFAGSGTTLLAAQRLGRTAIGYDVSPEYCALARKRLEEQTSLLPAVQAAGS
ncbi:MAG: DNA-methyltransferase [Leptospirillum sp.]